MGFDHFGNEILDTRSETGKQIDSLLGEYCRMFNKLDKLGLDEDDLLRIMKRSILEHEDYLSNFVPRDYNETDHKISVIEDVIFRFQFCSLDEDFDIAVADSLSYMYDKLSLQELSITERYSIITMLYKIMLNSGDIDSSSEKILDEIEKTDISTIISRASEYRWLPDEIHKLIELRDKVLKDKVLKDDTQSIIDSINEIYSKLQITRYYFMDRQTLLKEFNSLKQEIADICGIQFSEDSIGRIKDTDDPFKIDPLPEDLFSTSPLNLQDNKGCFDASLNKPFMQESFSQRSFKPQRRFFGSKKKK